MRQTSRHQVDSLQNLERSDLLDDKTATELIAHVRLIGTDAADKVRFGLDQGSKEVVKTGVEVLGEG